MQAFKALGLGETILLGVRDAGYDTPTPIQLQAIPPAAQGRDMIGCAQTGTGKTAAFVLPMLHRLAENATGGPRRVRALVVTPTRELALQVEEAVRVYGKHASLTSAAIFGGVSMERQVQKLRRGVDIVVATPGRLLDHVDRGTLDLSRVETLVLDEADHMLDMGFIRDVRKIVGLVPRKRQTLLFSATMPPPLQELAGTILIDPQMIEIGKRRDPAASVEQHACIVPHTQKMDLLLHVLETERTDRVIVFTRTKHRANRVAKKLTSSGHAAAAIHGNRSQNQRERALEDFRDGRVTVLVATDIAARGIDVDGISHVINFNTPNIPESYIHRIGRTGRADTEGRALTFVGEDEVDHLRGIERHTSRPLPRLEVDGFDTFDVAAAPARADKNPRSHNGGGRGGSGRGGNGGGRNRRSGGGGSGSGRGRRNSGSRARQQ